MPPRQIHHEPQSEEDKKSERWENVVAIVVVAAIAVAIAGVFLGWYTGEPEEQEQYYLVSLGANPMTGNDSAPVVMVEFSDFRCPACQMFHNETWPRLKAEYIDTGKVLFAYRDYPLQEIHFDTLALSSAASCAHEQGKFWEMHDLLYERQPRISELSASAAELGLNVTRFDACMQGGAYEEEALIDRQQGLNEGGVSSTPTFFINGKRIVGAAPYGDFKKAIDEALARSNKK